MSGGIQIAQFLATAGIGGLAAVIAWRQWRTARDKVKLDLFDRRFNVFMDARKLASEGVQLGKFTDPGLPNEVIARAKFLFGDDVRTELDKLHLLCTQVTLEKPDAPEQLSSWLDNFETVIAPYMNMGHLKS